MHKKPRLFKLRFFILLKRDALTYFPWIVKIFMNQVVVFSKICAFVFSILDLGKHIVIGYGSFNRTEVFQMGKYQLWLLILAIVLGVFGVGVADCQENQESMVIHEMSLENKRAVRIELLKQMVLKYENDQTFAKVQDYMEMKYHELHKSKPPKSPSLVIQETFQRTRAFMDKTRPYIGSSFTRVFDPVQIEKNVHKYIWLKGICFLVLGIGDEHRIALSYFYLPGNEDLKKEFMKDVVIYSFPEVPDVPENQAWQTEMIGVMERLGYQIFNIARYVPDKTDS
jgi:hypothetical protein